MQIAEQRTFSKQPATHEKSLVASFQQVDLDSIFFGQNAPLWQKFIRARQ